MTKTQIYKTYCLPDKPKKLVAKVDYRSEYNTLKEEYQALQIKYDELVEQSVHLYDIYNALKKQSQ